jgi:hypothetical protein
MFTRFVVGIMWDGVVGNEMGMNLHLEKIEDVIFISQ